METFLRRVETNSNGMVTKSAAEKFFSFIDLNGNQEITSEELERFDFHKAAEDVPAIKDLVLEMVATALAEGVNIDFIDEPTSVENMNNYFHEEDCVTSSDPPGHLKPLGHHRPPIGGILETTSFPDPKTFFVEHIKGSKPVLFKGILEKGALPAFKLWTDEYLRENFGNDIVTVELGKKENRDAGGDTFTFTKFLDKYIKENIYMVNDISENMARDVNLPPCMACGGIQRAIQNVILWFSSGGTKSVLHNDGLDNINCLLDGEKYLVMIDKKQSKLIETEHWKSNGAYHKVDVEKVDMIKYPQFQDVTWYEVKMKKGDCLFIPFKWYHHVDSSTKGRNMALNFWFNHLMIFNDTDCKGVDTDKLLPLSGIREKTKNVESIRGELMGAFDNENVLSCEEFAKILESTEMVDKDTAKKFFRYIDMNEDQKITPEEMQIFDIKKAVDEIPPLQKAVREYLELAEEDEEDENKLNEEDTNGLEEAEEEEIGDKTSSRDEL